MVRSSQVGMAKALAIGAAALAMTGCGQPAAPVERSAPAEMPAAVPVAAEPTVASGESWTCTYVGYAIRENEAPRPVIVRFTVEGEELVSNRPGPRYRILQNNQYALIAAGSIAEIEPNHSEPSIASWTILIDKRNGFFSRVTLINQQGRSGAARDGSCIRD